ASRERPGECAEYVLRGPPPAPVVDASEQFREKYLFGDWLGARSRLAADGVRPLVLFITDPFVNTTGGLRRGVSEYDLLGLDLLPGTDKPPGRPRGEFHLAVAHNPGTGAAPQDRRDHIPSPPPDVATAHPPPSYLPPTPAP